LDLHFRTQIDAIHLLPTQIVQGDSHRLILAADFDHAKELQAVTGWPIGFQAIGDTNELDLSPKVLSSLLGPKVPACRGPATNSQKGLKSVNWACAGS
jgi:hypothetical protein